MYIVRSWNNFKFEAHYVFMWIDIHCIWIFENKIFFLCLKLHRCGGVNCLTVSFSNLSLAQFRNFLQVWAMTFYSSSVNRVKIGEAWISVNQELTKDNEWENVVSESESEKWKTTPPFFKKIFFTPELSECNIRELMDWLLFACQSCEMNGYFTMSKRRNVHIHCHKRFFTIFV